MNPSIVLLSLGLSLFTTAAWAGLKPGDDAPDFTVDAALGGREFKFSLAEALEKGPVVLYFYPKSFTLNARRVASKCLNASCSLS